LVEAPFLIDKGARIFASLFGEVVLAFFFGTLLAWLDEARFVS
jgi:hypothetical protein